MYGGEGSDRLDGGHLDDDVYGGDGDDFLTGDFYEYNNPVGGNDYVDGGRGNDHLYNDPGADTWAGGPGVDTFHLDNPGAKGAPVDTILDFKPGVDILLVETVNFEALPEAPFDSTAPLARGKFFLGGKAKDKGDRLGYNPKNGELLYDPNGSKKGQKVVIAELSEGLNVTHDDFLVAS
jgi:Ca2+-binding RTX toxin-like protein